MPWQFRYEPIQQWPRAFTAERGSANHFRASREQTERELADELRKIDAKDCVVQLALTRSDFRADGQPKTYAEVSHPGVILTFERDGQFVSMPCDKYDKWTTNLRAIVKTLDALRAVDRHGVTTGREQYEGFAQLPGPGGEPPAFKNASAAADWLIQQLAGAVTTDADTAKIAILASPRELEWARREIAKKLHPDTPTGDATLYKRMEVAVAMIEAHQRKLRP